MSDFSDQNIAEELLGWVFHGEAPWSVYAVSQLSRYDEGHAIGLIAFTIASSDHSVEARKKYRERIDRWESAVRLNRMPKQGDSDDYPRTRPPATIVFPSEAIPESVVVTKSPEKNLSFVAADELHYDIAHFDASLIADKFLKFIKSNDVLVTTFNPCGYQIQAAVALSSCIRKFNGCTLPQRGSKDSRDATLSPGEQMERLRYIAGDFGFSDRVH